MDSKPLRDIVLRFHTFYIHFDFLYLYILDVGCTGGQTDDCVYGRREWISVGQERFLPAHTCMHNR